MYRNTIHIPHLILASLAASFMFAGCSKEPSVTDNGKALNFSISVPDITVSKASPVTSISKFYTKGFTGEQQWFPLEGDAAELVELTDGSKAYPTYRWRQGDTKAFFAYSDNLPDGTSAAITKDGVTLTCNTMPADAADQADVLLGRYIGDGKDEGQAEIKFYHPLAQVVFKAGMIDGADAFTKIEIEDVFAAGSTTLSSSTLESGSPAVAAFIWNVSGKMKVSQTISEASIPAAGSKIGESFMLIPQNLAEHNIKITVTATKGTETKYLTTTLDSGSLVAGRTSSYAINYDGMNVSLSVTVEPWDSDGGQKEAVAIEEKKNYPEGALPGVFTINASGDKVYFSKGNLQFRATADGSGTDLKHMTAEGVEKQGTWRFAQEQWHTVGASGYIGNVYETIDGSRQLCDNMIGVSEKDEEARRKYSGWVDIFPDCSSGYMVNPWDFDDGSIYGPGPNYSMNNPDRGFDATSGTNWEWGHYNAISNGGNAPGIWRTPLNGELEYLLVTRKKTNLTIGGLNNVNAVGAAVEGIPGIMIFPDDFTWPSTNVPEMKFSENDVIIQSEAFSTNWSGNAIKVDYSASEFENLEECGVAFLPCTVSLYHEGSNVAPYGFSTTSGPVYLIYRECFNYEWKRTSGGPGLFLIEFLFMGKYPADASSGASFKYWNYFYYSYYFSVRLVCDAPSE